MPRVGINAQLLSAAAGYRRAGIHYYISQLIQHIPPVPAWSYELFSHNFHGISSLPASVSKRQTSWPTGRRLVRIAWEQLIWPWQAYRMKLDLLHSLAFVAPRWRVCPIVVTIYDVSFLTHPEQFPFLQRLYLRTQTSHACRFATRLIAISESGRRDLQRYFQVSPARIDVVYPGVDAAYQELPNDEVEAFRQQQGIGGKFILHVGTLQPRKNLPLLIDAFAALRKHPDFHNQDITLVMVGGKGWFFDEIFARVEEHSLSAHVRFIGYVPDRDLPYWYNSAAVLVFPSVYEGFGLPIVQAMACGTPVIAANTSSIPEVVGGAALLFSPEDTGALTNHLATVLQDERKAAIMSAAGKTQVRQFSWEQSGRQLHLTYQQALDE